MITQEKKAKIFALYWKQEIDISLKGTPISASASIIVKPALQISHKDAIKVSEIWGSEVSSAILGRSIVNRLISREYEIVTEFRNIIAVIDFLRSKGYALPAYGFSVEKLVKEGVFKLIENEK